ncbi:MAG: recombinase family protein [Bdellovibrionaceae bacterium]|nr:recombinase family protein [Bdellovibrionales bacterium]MCB9254146.1 recombinase family protein [Pseudobdellovibrionaceae bacterium]
MFDFIEGTHLPRKIPPEFIAEIYEKEGLSAQQISERIGLSKQAVLHRLRKVGVRNGRRGRAPDNYRYRNPPFGYKVVIGQLKLNSSEIRVVRLVLKLANEGKTSKCIAGILNERKVPARRGGPWDRARVKRVLQRWRGKV